MALFRRKKEPINTEIPEEIETLIQNGQALVDETRRRMKEHGFRVDLTGKMQLKSDCEDLEKRIKRIHLGNAGEKEFEALRLSIIRLETTVEWLSKER